MATNTAYGYSPQGAQTSAANPGLDAFGGPGDPVTPSSASVKGGPLSGSAWNNGAQTGAAEYKYPLLNRDDYKGKVTFQAYKVIPPKIGMDDILQAERYLKDWASQAASLQRKKDESEAAGGANDNAQAQNMAEQKEGKKQSSAINSGGSTTTGIQMLPIEGEKCELYLPMALIVNDQITYETGNLNQLGATALTALGQGNSLVGSLKAGLEQSIATTIDFFKGGLAEDAARLAVARASASKLVPSESFKNAISIAGQVTMNPNTRALFKSVPLRTFSFSFKFLPKSADEAEVVKNIIKFFRVHAYPETIPEGAELSVGYKFPNMFEIKTLYDGKQVGTKIKKCYLQSIQHTYNPTGMGFHADGQPVEVDLTLTFTEHVTINRKDIDEGF